MKNLLTTACLFIATVVAMSCSYPSPTPIGVSEGPPARLEWLLGPGALLNAVHLTESGVGAAVGEQGAILVTSDAGVTWTAAESGTDRSLRGVAFLDASNGVAVGAGGTLLRTDDAGRTWAAIGTGSAAELRGVAFGGPTAGIVVGEDGVVIRTADGGRVWQSVASGTTSTLRTVRFVSPSVAVAAGDGGTLVRSVDGGTSWAVVASPTGAAIRGLHFVNEMTGVAVGGDDYRWRAERVVLRTADGGATWTEIAAPKGTRLYGVAAAGDGSIVAVGEGGASSRSIDEGLTWQASQPVKMTSKPNTPEARWDTSNSFASVSPAGPALVAVTYGGRILRSTDGGGAWSPVQQMPDTGNIEMVARADSEALVIGADTAVFRSAGGAGFEKTESAEARMREFVFLDPLVGVAVGGPGKIQRTVDGGKTWAVVEGGTDKQLFGVAFSDDKQGIVTGLTPGRTNPVMLRTVDGGLTWQEQTCEVTICDKFGFTDVALLPSQTGIAVGFPGIIVKTTDGGRSWTRLEQGLTNGLLWAVAMLDENTAVVAGWHGVILRTDDGGATWSRRESGTNLHLRRIAFADASRGMIVGAAGTILTTTDGGLTWQREPIRTTRNLEAVTFDHLGTPIITGYSPGIVFRYARTTDAATQPRDTTGGSK